MRGNGQFNEIVEVTGFPDETLTIVDTSSGMYWRQPISPNTPAAPIPVPLGTVLVAHPTGSEHFELEFLHIDTVGYSVTVDHFFKCDYRRQAQTRTASR